MVTSVALTNQGRHRALQVGMFYAAFVLATAGSWAQQTDPNQQEVARLLQSGEAAAAEQICRDWITHSPESVPAHLHLARALEAQQRNREAVSVLLAKAQEWIRSERYSASEQLLQDAVRLQPDSARILALLGRVRVLQRKYLSAEEPLGLAVESGLQDLRTLYYLAATLWENGKLKAAEERYRQLVAVSARKDLFVHQLGRLLLWQGRFEEASALLVEAAQSSPTSPDIYLDLAAALDGAGQLEQAISAYRRVIALAPEYSKAHYSLAQLLTRVGERQEARQELAIYRRLYEEEVERTRLEGLLQAEIDRGLELLRTGESQAAIQHLQALPPTAESLAALARAYTAAGEHWQAVAALERAVAASPQRSDVRQSLTEARLSAGSLP